MLTTSFGIHQNRTNANAVLAAGGRIIIIIIDSGEHYPRYSFHVSFSAIEILFTQRSTENLLQIRPCFLICNHSLKIKCPRAKNDWVSNSQNIHKIIFIILLCRYVALDKLDHEIESMIHGNIRDKVIVKEHDYFGRYMHNRLVVYIAGRNRFRHF